MAPAGRPAEAGLDGLGPEVNRVFLFVGEEEVVEAVAVEIDEAEAVVVARGVHEGDTGRQGVGEFLPSALAVGPREDGGLLVVADEEFAAAIAVEIAEADATVHGERTGQNELPAV